jgi:hypothetical protein
MLMKILRTLVIFLSFYSGAKAQCEDLDPEDSIYGYRERNGRCEGFYNSNVSGFTIQVLSLTQGTISYALNSNEKLRIATRSLRDFESISVRGVNFSMNRNYRLDLSLVAGSIADVPVKEVLQPNDVEPKNLGLFGFVERSGQRYYVPVSPMSSLSGSIINASKLNLQLVSNVNIKEVAWRFAVSKNDICGNYSDILKLSNAPYSRNSPIGLEIPTALLETSDEVIVCIQINIQAANGLEINENIQLLIPKMIEGV